MRFFRHGVFQSNNDMMVHLMGGFSGVWGRMKRCIYEDGVSYILCIWNTFSLISYEEMFNR